MIQKPMLFLLIGVAILVAICSFIALAANREIVLERKDIAGFKADMVEATTIRLTGLVMHSSLVIKDVQVIQENDALRIFVHLILSRSGLSGNLDKTILIPNTVNTITFGNNKVVIWERK